MKEKKLQACYWKLRKVFTRSFKTQLAFDYVIIVTKTKYNRNVNMQIWLLKKFKIKYYVSKDT